MQGEYTQYQELFKVTAHKVYGLDVSRLSVLKRIFIADSSLVSIDWSPSAGRLSLLGNDCISLRDTTDSHGCPRDYWSIVSLPSPPKRVAT